MANTQNIIYDAADEKVIIKGKVYTKDQLSTWATIYLFAGALIVVIGFFIMPIGLLFILTGILLLLQGFAYNSSSKILNHKINEYWSEKESKDVSPPKTTDTGRSPYRITVSLVPETPSGHTYYTEADITVPHENHNVAGTSYRQKEIASLGSYNIDYEQSRKEIIDGYIMDERIYEITFCPINVQLIEEPENIHDPNAIKVMIDNVHVGYIKRGSCTHVKNLMSSNKIQRITADIHGGNYKEVYSEFDEDKMDDVIHIKNKNTDFFVSICIYLKEDE